MTLPLTIRGVRTGGAVLLRALVLAPILFLVVIYLVNIPLAYRGALAYAPYAVPDQQWTPAELRAALAQTGMPIEVYGALRMLAPSAGGLVFIIVGLIIFWRKSDTWFGLYLAVELIVFGATSSNPTYAIADILPWIHPVTSLLGNLGWILLPVLLYTFPDGRLVPRWGVIVLAAWFTVTIKAAFFDPSSLAPPPLALGVLALTFVIGISAQVYRYRRASHAIQRQQTKWVLWALLVFVLYAVISLGTLEPRRQLVGTRGSGLLIELVAGMVGSTVSAAIPFAIGVAILRYRLWDIDVIILRTVTYSVLTALLVGVYFGGVVILQQLFVALTGQRSEVAVIISTLAIYALFVPLRNRIQTAIDRRFFRRKYNAQQALESFALTARDEVDAGQLTAHLLDAVGDTLQPERMTLWLRSEAPRHSVADEVKS